MPHRKTSTEVRQFDDESPAQRQWEIICLEFGEGYQWLIRKLYGRVPADLGEMFEWTLRLGVPVLPAIDEVDGIRPMQV